MKARVFLLRRRGRRLAWDKVLNGPSHVGDILTYSINHGDERYRVASLRPAEPMLPQPLPDLYEPELLLIASSAFRLRGFERCEDGGEAFGAVQEWHCEVDGRP